MNQIKASIHQLLILVMALVFATVRTCRFWRNTPEAKEPINTLIQFCTQASKQRIECRAAKITTGQRKMSGQDDHLPGQTKGPPASLSKLFSIQCFFFFFFFSEIKESNKNDNDDRLPSVVHIYCIHN